MAESTLNKPVSAQCTHQPLFLLAHEFGDQADAQFRLEALAKTLLVAGCDVQCAGRQAWHQHGHTSQLTFWATPRPWPKLQERLQETPVPLVSHCSELLANGWGDQRYLMTLLQGWCQVLQACKPDWVVADSAPAAQLSAHMLGIPVLQLGNDVTLQVLQQPMPELRWWLGTKYFAMAAAHDEQLSAGINSVLSSLPNPSSFFVASASSIWSARVRAISSVLPLVRNMGQLKDGIVVPVPDHAGLPESYLACDSVGYWSGVPTHIEVCGALAKRQVMLLYPKNNEQWLRSRHLQDCGLAVVVTPNETHARHEQCVQRVMQLAKTAPVDKYVQQLEANPCMPFEELVHHCLRGVGRHFVAKNG